MEYDRWQVRYHGAVARLNFPFGTRLVDLVPPEPGVVSSAMVQEHREVWERLEAEATAEAYMQELRRRHLKLVEVERLIFTGAEGGEVMCSPLMMRSKVGGEDEEINIDDWRRVFPDDPGDDTSPDLARGTLYLTRKDGLNLYFGRK